MVNCWKILKMNWLINNFISCQFNSIQFQKKLSKWIAFRKKNIWNTLCIVSWTPVWDLDYFPGTVRRLGIFIDSLALTRYTLVPRTFIPEWLYSLLEILRKCFTQNPQNKIFSINSNIGTNKVNWDTNWIMSLT